MRDNPPKKQKEEQPPTSETEIPDDYDFLFNIEEPEEKPEKKPPWSKELDWFGEGGI